MNPLMDVLLVNPPREVPQKADFPPIGLAYICAVLKKEGISAGVLDACAFTWRKLAKLLAAKSPRIVGVPCWTLERACAFTTARLVRSVLPQARIVMGGHHATSFPQHMFAKASADAVVLGEGEVTMLALARTMLAGGDVASVRGIAYLRDGQVRCTGPRELVAELDSLPYPSYEEFDLDDYLGLPEVSGRSGCVITSRGCPQACVFCSGSVFWRRKWRARSAENVLGELQWLRDRHGVRNVIFFDDNFAVSKDRAMAICRGIIERKLQINWVASSHVTQVDGELLQWMRRSGCYRIDFGVESGSPRVLRDIRKGQTTEQIERAFRLAHEAGIKPRAFLVVGSPGESIRTVDETVALARRIRPYDSGAAGIMWVLPDTALYESAKAGGLLTDGTWLDTDETIYYTCEHNLAELEALRDRLIRGLARSQGTFKAAAEYWARKAYYRFPRLQKLRRLRRLFA